MRRQTVSRSSFPTDGMKHLRPALSRSGGLSLGLLLGFVAVSSPVLAEIPAIVARDAAPLETVDRLVMPAVDNEALFAEDQAAAGPGVPVRFALPIEVAIDPSKPSSRGTWEALPDGDMLWRLRVFSDKAQSLNFGFTSFQMPVGGSLIVYSPDYEWLRGPYTETDNESHGELWIPLVERSEAVIEARVPSASLSEMKLKLGWVNHGYRQFGQPVIDPVFESGACNVDVICPEGDGWRDEIRSVVAYSTGGSIFCTGFLVNNTAQDLTPYVMTANHCGIDSGNAASLVVFFNFDNTTCRPPGSAASGGPGDGSLAQSSTGSFWRASHAPSDFTIVELDDPVPSGFNPHWAGWDRRSTDQLSAIAIHHPSGDEKRISFEDQPTTTTSYLSSTSPGNGTHIRVEDWDVGTTEGGSSGSPLFSPDHFVVGQLHGGFAACGNNDADWYGRVSVSWEGGGTAASRLRDWLDPGDTGVETLDGRDEIEGPDFDLAVTPAAASVCAPGNTPLTVDLTSIGGFSESVTLSTVGTPSGISAAFSPNPIVPTGASAMTVTAAGGATLGAQSFEVVGTGTTVTKMASVDLFVANAVAGTPTLISPANGASLVPAMPTYSWSATAQAATYAIEVATDPGFSNIVDSATVTGTTYDSQVALMTSGTYFWRVRAANGCGTSSFSSVGSFTVEPAPGDCPAGVATIDVYSDDFESGAAAWTTSGMASTWTLSSARTVSGTNAFHAADSPAVSDQYLISPAIELPADGLPLSLKFWNHQTIEPQNGPGCFDGAVVEISTNGGMSYTRLETELQTDPYDGTVSNQFGSPIADENAWCGDPQDWLDSIVDLDAYAGQNVMFRFRLATDSSVGREGWYIDDVRVTACATNDIFSDGFESGNIAAWSSSVP